MEFIHVTLYNHSHKQPIPHMTFLIIYALSLFILASCFAFILSNTIKSFCVNTGDTYFTDTNNTINQFGIIYHRIPVLVTMLPNLSTTLLCHHLNLDIHPILDKRSLTNISHLPMVFFCCNLCLMVLLRPFIPLEITT